MTTRIALSVIAALFVVAEVARPTHFPAKKSAHALIVHTQAVAGRGAYASLDPNLLDDLPRIHPDAVGQVACSRTRDGSIRLFGQLSGGHDGYGRDDGSAVFIVSDGARLGAEATIFGNRARPRDFAIDVQPKDLSAGKQRLHVALVSGDQRGFFLLPQTIAVTIDGAAHESGDCQTPQRLGLKQTKQR